MLKDAATMSRTQFPKTSKPRDLVQQPTPPTQDEDDSEVSVEESDSENESEKDETEEELERLVFGDKAGFRAGLRDFSLQEQAEEEQNDGAGATGLEGFDDADLFFTDLTPGEGVQQSLVPAVNEEHEDATFRSRHPPAWEDSDDERLMVSLATVPRLRKLRRTEAEDIVNGKEYSRRLRRQFELLNPMPQWAQEAITQPAKKKRRLSQDEDRLDDDASSEGMDIDDENPSVAPLSKLLQSTESLVRNTDTAVGKKRRIRPETINIERQKDIDLIQPSAITSLTFHPTLPLLLSSGPSSTLYLHHISPSPPAPTANPLLTSLHVRGSHLTTTAFHPSDARIFLSSGKRYFHIWNLSTGRVEKISTISGHQHEQKSMEIFKLSPDGRHVALRGTSKRNTGTVNILDAATLQWTSMVRVDSRGGVADFAWWRDGSGLCIASKNGEITEWDVDAQRIVARWQDEGAVGTTTLALGGNAGQKSAIGSDRWVAVGSSSGIVNIYDRREWIASAAAASKTKGKTSEETSVVPANPKPTRLLDNLTTPITQLVFSPDGQVMAMASKWSRDALRLVHLPSCTVFKNWPTSGTPLGRITGVAFAGGEIVEGDEVHSALAVANEQGKIRLWHIR